MTVDRTPVDTAVEQYGDDRVTEATAPLHDQIAALDHDLASAQDTIAAQAQRIADLEAQLKAIAPADDQTALPPSIQMARRHRLVTW